MAEKTHAQRLAECVGVAERAQRGTGMPADIWWQDLAETLREAQADRERLEALERAASQRNIELLTCWSCVVVTDGQTHHKGETLTEAIDALRSAYLPAQPETITLDDGEPL